MSATTSRWTFYSRAFVASITASVAVPTKTDLDVMLQSRRESQAVEPTVAFLTGHLGMIKYLPPTPATSHAYYVADELGVPPWLHDILQNRGWRPLWLHGKTDYDAVNSSMRSKHAKIPENRWPALASYDFLVWFDDKFRVDVAAVLRAITWWPPYAAVALRRHPGRCVENFPNCSVLEEFTASVRQQHRYRRQAKQTRAYIAHQKRIGLPTSGRPLFQGGFIIYRQGHRETVRFQERWLAHIVEAGINDQVSLFFVAQLFASHIAEFVGDWGQQVWAGVPLPVAPGETLALLG
eukprot:TRINITY_DN27675_c0_g1_i1.p1 TRINITY_DN27675_c0_g1~~TRINITY_DN27675_c0_g1_i1.p1  ORF type:complete len:294 (-),score=39.26 TRINITY_DN27675_c0_g1_i1:149-1030(-)